MPLRVMGKLIAFQVDWKTMWFSALKSPLTAHDRLERRRLIFADTVSLVTLFAITALLAVLTNYLYQSYASHQVALANRWLERGEQALRDGKPQVAIDALSSALAYSPSQRSTEIKLAEALAAAGRVQEATVYFNALLESEQGNGLINLQLARLAARQGNPNEAISDYQKAIYGNWEGDGYVRRREVRLELINYLTEHQLFDQARSELLVASGNAPEEDISIQLDIARRMEQAQDPGDALHLYKMLLRHHGTLREALEGAGNTAFQLGRYAEAKRYLARSVDNAGADEEPNPEVEQSRERLNEATRLLLLYPSSRLSTREQNVRILADRKLAMARLAQCTRDNPLALGTNSAEPATPAAAAKSHSGSLNGSQDGPQDKSITSLANPLKNFASRFSRHPADNTDNQKAAPSATALLQGLADRWKELPSKILLPDLDSNPDLAQTQLQLIYDTELVTQQVCGEPGGDDALLLKIAQAPNQVEQE
jgi:tetratricopeptide (TPR) repeat protein